ncbi:MAG: T9SS type A sorting domain-containing protein, partial [Candidatus Poribacteria bacterium]|nr:T9SS type A sorting domain-containing protein [Candidatus Poribacteria bacterium]
GSMLASGLSDGTVKLWDVGTRENIATLEGHTDLVASVSFSPDGSILASGAFDGMVKLWDVGTRENIATLEGHTDLMLSVSFSPDGSMLAFGAFDVIGAFDVMVKLWDVASYITQLAPEKVAGDANGDGVVNIQDLVLVASTLGTTGQSTADVNADGVVDIRDLVKVAGELGNAAAAPSLHPQALAMFTAADVQKWIAQAQYLNLTDVTSQRGIRFLEQLLAALIPKETALLPNYPNPFNPETWIPYQLTKPADVTLTIYTVNGQVVRRLVLGHQAPGMYHSKARAAYWDGRNAVGEAVASGIYFYTLTAGDFTATRKMLIRK